MAISKSAKIQAEIEKVTAKINEQQARLKELEQKKLEAENSEIVEIVRGMSVSLTDLPTLLQTIKSGGTLGQNVTKSDPDVYKRQVQGSTDISGAMLADLEATLETLGLGSLLGLWLQSLLIHVTMWAINIVIFVIVYGRMIEIYLLTSLAPIPVATLSNRELGNTGQNYLKSLFAVGFQGLLILVCVAIYAVLIQGIATGGDPIGAIWGCMGYSVLLCFCLFKTGSIARSVFSAH